MSSPKVIGEGSYGCVHKPALRCNKNETLNKSHNKVSKLMVKNDIKKEMKEYELIDKADPVAEFYLGKPDSCKVSTSYSNTHTLDKCENLLDNDPYLNVHLTKYSLLIMNDGGKNLQQYAKYMSRLENTSLRKLKMEEFWIEAHRILMSLKMLADNGIVHHDMKQQNIVYDPTTKRINLIDFGLMTTKEAIIKKAASSKYYLAMHHWSYPFEYNFINKNAYDEISSKNKDTRSKWFLDLIMSISTKPRDKFTGAFKTFYSTIQDDQKKWPVQENKRFSSDFLLKHFGRTIFNQMHKGKGDYEKFCNKSVDTIDSYGVGMGFIYVLKKTFHLIDHPFAMDLLQLFMSMVDFDLEARATVDTIIPRFEDILEENGILARHKQQFVNHKLVSGRDIIDNVEKHIEKIDEKKLVLSHSELESKHAETVIQKICGEGKELNPNTNRCINICKPGYTRNADFNCRKRVNSQRKTKKIKNN